MQDSQSTKLNEEKDQQSQISINNSTKTFSFLYFIKHIFQKPLELVFLIIAIGFIMSVGYRFSKHFIGDSLMAQRNLPIKTRRKLKQINKLSYSQSPSFVQAKSPLSERDFHLFQNKPFFDGMQGEDGIRIWYIFKKENMQKLKDKNNGNNRGCALVNSLSLLKFQTLGSLQSLLNTNYIQIAILFTKLKDDHAQNLIQSKLSSLNYFISNQRVIIDSDYLFLQRIVKSCNKISYLFSNFIVDEVMALNLQREMKKISSQQMIYSAYYKSIGGKRVKLPSLKKVSFENVNQQELHTYLYIFDTNLLTVITPLSFDYYAKYSLEQIILLPLLIIAQSSEKLIETKQLIHGFNQKHYSRNQFKLKPPLISQKSLCFVSYPSSPTYPSFKQLNSYLESLIHMERNEISVSVILNFPYKLNQTTDILLIAEKMKEIKSKSNFTRVRLRINYNKTFSTLSIYEAAYYYCPQNSVIVSSRHNVIFDQQFAEQVSQAIQQKYHYVLAGFRFEEGTKIDYQKLDLKTSIRKSNLFQRYFTHFQIFKSQFFKSMPPWSIKCDEIQFYQTQAVIVNYLLESTNANFAYINKTIVTIAKRTPTQEQQKQIQNIKNYSPFHLLQNNQFAPFKFSVLENEALKRFAPDKIQKIIHQIILQNGSSKFVSLLQNTIKAHNSGFKIMVWRQQNITIQQFPYTYEIIQRLIHQNKHKNYKKFMGQIMKLQLLLKYGGIYLNYISQCKKSLNPFLKYQLLYFDCGLQIAKNKGLIDWYGISGAYQNHYLLKIFLDQVIYKFSVNLNLGQLIINSKNETSSLYFSKKQYFDLIGFGCHLLTPYQKQNSNACENQAVLFESDQQIYKVQIEKGLTISIGLPCRQYQEAFIIRYHILPNFDESYKQK